MGRIFILSITITAVPEQIRGGCCFTFTLFWHNYQLKNEGKWFTPLWDKIKTLSRRELNLWICALHFMPCIPFSETVTLLSKPFPHSRTALLCGKHRRPQSNSQGSVSQWLLAKAIWEKLSLMTQASHSAEFLMALKLEKNPWLPSAANVAVSTMEHWCKTVAPYIEVIRVRVLI